MVATITALVCGITWWGEGELPDGPATVSNINNLVGSLYASLAFMGTSAPVALLPRLYSVAVMILWPSVVPDPAAGSCKCKRK